MVVSTGQGSLLTAQVAVLYTEKDREHCQRMSISTGDSLER